MRIFSMVLRKNMTSRDTDDVIQGKIIYLTRNAKSGVNTFGFFIKILESDYQVDYKNMFCVRYPIFSGMTSSVSRDVIFFLKTIENILIIFNIKFHRNQLVRSRDIDVLV